MLQDDLDLRIGARLRAEREARGWSLSDLAGRAGVSRAMIHKVERGESSPTAKLLGKLSGAFGLTMSALLARAEAAGGRVARRADQPLWIDPETGYARRQVSPPSDLPLEVVDVTLPPGAAAPMPASAFGFIRQMIWVLDGELVFDEGPTRHRLGPGDCLLLGPPADCAFRNESEAPCRYAVLVLRPG
ncbi:MAG: XRE family transcriptional regulator [Pseudomonadota bacterium]|nr:XRE family transcriptional regulator [Pseudomonadota bacterium]